MLDIARQKMLKLSENVNLVNGDILRLPFRNNIFDITTISFGIRNVDNTLLGLKEMARVTKPGGKVIVLEFGKPKGLMKSFYILYSKIIMPFIGGIISGNKGAYSYLPATALSYPCREKFIRIMQETSMFQNYSFEPLTGGIAYLYVGIVKDSK
jgi:demethylmenaquinone methyltransferase/2-methoxy-6-polyprenyl-1,4-benzoquinol methylase